MTYLGKDEIKHIIKKITEGEAKHDIERALEELLEEVQEM